MSNLGKLLTFVIFLFSVFSVGCKGNTEGQSFEQKRGNFIAGMPNPWTDIDAKAASEAAGFAFAVPENADKVIFRLLNSENLTEMDFYLHDTKCTARTKPSKGLEDISGMWYGWEKEKKSTVLGFPGKERFAKNDSNAVSSGLWHNKKKGRTYSLSCVCGISDNESICHDSSPLSGLAKNAAKIFAAAK